MALAASVVAFIPALFAPYKLLQQFRTLRRQKRERRAAAQRAVMATQTADVADLQAIQLAELQAIPLPVEAPLPTLESITAPLLPSVDITLQDDERQEPVVASSQEDRWIELLDADTDGSQSQHDRQSRGIGLILSDFFENSNKQRALQLPASTTDLQQSLTDLL